MTGEGQTKRSLDVLPQRIANVHGCLRDTIDTLCILEDFLFGGQVREVAEKPDKEPPSGVVDECFDNLAAINNSIQQCHDQLRHIIDKLGAGSADTPSKL